MKTWEEMSRTERKVILCKDVLARIKQERLTVNWGFYINGIYRLPEILGREKFEGAVTPDDCLSIEKNCAVCARGALLLSRIRLFNSVDWGGLRYAGNLGVVQEQTTDILSEAFYYEELLAIEAAFEARNDEANDAYIGEDEEYSQACIGFGLEYEHPDARVVAIMENIIENHGDVLGYK